MPHKLFWFLTFWSFLAEKAKGEDQCLPTNSTEPFARTRSLVRDPQFRGMANIIGLDDVKVTLKEAVIIPLDAAFNAGHVFWRSAEQIAVLLAGPSGLGKRAIAEAAAAEAAAKVLHLSAVEALHSEYCRMASSSFAACGSPTVVVIEHLELQPKASHTIRECLIQAAAEAFKISIIATISLEPSNVLSISELSPFGYIVHIRPPDEADRKKFLLLLLAHVSRIDPHWASALPESAIDALVSSMNQYTYAEIEFVLRRAYLQSSKEEGRDPVAIHHLEKILRETPPRAVRGYRQFGQHVFLNSTRPGQLEISTSEISQQNEKNDKPRSRDGKDPLQNLFKWCNSFVPEVFQLQPVVWAMMFFGIIAHFMARNMYQPYNHKKRRQGRGSMFGDTASYSFLDEEPRDWMSGQPSFASFPMPTSTFGAPRARPSSFVEHMEQHATQAQESASTSNTQADLPTPFSTEEQKVQLSS